MQKAFMEKLIVDWDFDGGSCSQVQVRAMHLKAYVQRELSVFENDSVDRNTQKKITNLIKEASEKWGYGTLRTARLNQSIATPDVIAPAWRHEGDKQSICI